MADGVVGLTPLSDRVPADVQAEIEAVAAEIVAGTFSPFDGPVHAQDGSLIVAEGETIDDAGLWAMEFLVQGTTGTVAGP